MTRGIFWRKTCFQRGSLHTETQFCRTRRWEFYAREEEEEEEEKENEEEQKDKEEKDEEEDKPFYAREFQH